jgi:hypothetical protein
MPRCLSKEKAGKMNNNCGFRKLQKPGNDREWRIQIPELFAKSKSLYKDRARPGRSKRPRIQSRLPRPVLKNSVPELAKPYLS